MLVGVTSDSPWIVIAVVRHWIPDEYFHAVDEVSKGIPISDLNL